MTFTTLLFERDGRVVTVTINRPDKLNALNAETLAELRTAFEAIAADDGVGVAVLTGAGEKSFVAGADIAELHAQDTLSGQAFARFGQGVFNVIAGCPKPVLSLIHI